MCQEFLAFAQSLPKWFKVNRSSLNKTLPLRQLTNTFPIFGREPDVRNFSAGDVIFSAGQAAEGLMYAVLDGEVEITVQDRVLETVTTNGVFGEMALIDQAPRSATAIAQTNGRLAAVTDKRFMVLVSQNPRFAIDMMQLHTQRVRRYKAS